MSLLGKRNFQSTNDGEYNELPIASNLLPKSSQTFSDYVFKNQDAMLLGDNPEQNKKTYMTDKRTFWSTFATWASDPKNVEYLRGYFLSYMQDDNSWVFSVFPVRITNKVHHVYNIIEFDPVPATIGTRKVPFKNIGFKMKSAGKTSVYRGQGFQVDYSYMKTDQGMEEWDMKVSMLTSNIWATIIYSALKEFEFTPTFYNTSKRLHPYALNPTSIDQCFRLRQAEYGCLNKKPQAIHVLASKCNRIFEQKQKGLRAFIADRADIVFTQLNDQTQIMYDTSGSSGVSSRISENVTSLAGLYPVYTVPMLSPVLQNGLDDAVLLNRTVTGSYFRIPDYSTSMDAKKYNSVYRTIRFFSMDRKDAQTVSLVRALRHSFEFMPTKECHDSSGYLNENEGKINRELLHDMAVNATIKNGDKNPYEKCETQMEGNEEDLSTLLAFRGKGVRVSKNKPAWYPICCFGEIEESQASTTNLIHVGKTLLKEIIKNLSPSQKIAIEEGIELANTLNSGNPHPNFISAITDTNGYEFTDTSSLKKTYSPGFDIEMVKPNKWGGLDIKFPFYGTDNTIDPLEKTKIPWGYGHISGLLTLYDYIQTNEGIENTDKEVARKINIFIPVFRELIKSIMNVTHDHPALDPRLVPTFHENENMDDFTRSMIVAWYFLFDNFKEPSLFYRTGRFYFKEPQKIDKDKEPYIPPLKKEDQEAVNLIIENFGEDNGASGFNLNLLEFQKIIDTLKDVDFRDWSFFTEKILNDIPTSQIKILDKFKEIFEKKLTKVPWDNSSDYLNENNFNKLKIIMPYMNVYKKISFLIDKIINYQVDDATYNFSMELSDFFDVFSNVNPPNDLQWDGFESTKPFEIPTIIPIIIPYTKAVSGKGSFKQSNWFHPKNLEDFFKVMDPKLTLLSNEPENFTLAVNVLSNNEILENIPDNNLSDFLKKVVENVIYVLQKLNGNAEDQKFENQILLIMADDKKNNPFKKNTFENKIWRMLGNDPLSEYEKNTIQLFYLWGVLDSQSYSLKINNFFKQKKMAVNAANSDLFIKKKDLPDLKLTPWADQNEGSADDTYIGRFHPDSSGEEIFTIHDNKYIMDAKQNDDGGLFKAEFDTFDPSSIGSTILTALPFINTRYPFLPRNVDLKSNNISNSVEAYRDGCMLVRNSDGSCKVTGADSHVVTANQKVLDMMYDESKLPELMETYPDLPFFYLYSMIYPLTGEPTGKDSIFDERWRASHDSMTFFDGLAFRILCSQPISIATLKKFETNNIAIPFGATLLRPYETQYMRSIIALADTRMGITFFSGIDNTIAFDQDMQHFSLQAFFDHTTVIQKTDSFVILPYVRGAAYIGGKGSKFINEKPDGSVEILFGEDLTEKGLTIRDEYLGDGLKMRDHSIIVALSCYNEATKDNLPLNLDITGNFDKVDFAGLMDESPDFVLERNSTMFSGVYTINHVLDFHKTVARYKQETFNHFQMCNIRRQNHWVHQATQYVYNSSGELEKTDSAHPWGEEDENMCERETSNYNITQKDMLNRRKKYKVSARF